MSAPRVEAVDSSEQIASLEQRLADCEAKLRTADELLRQKEEQLVRAQRLIAVGRFAAEIAHHMNDVLMGVAGCSRVARELLGPSSPASRLIDEIRKATDEGAVVVRRIALLDARRASAPRALDLNAVVERVAPLLRRVAGHACAVVVDPGPALFRAFADEAYVEQILVNLVIAAREALPSGGSIAVRTRNVTRAPPSDPIHDPADVGEHVLVEVEGVGATDRAERRAAAVAEPGLWVVRSFVEESGGEIELRGDAGFLVYLRRAPSGAPSVDAPRMSRLVDQGRRGTVLLVDDEPIVRVALRAALEQAGYRAIDAESATEALRVARAFPGPIHVLVTDVRMPGESGLALGAQLASERPGTRVVYMADWGDGAAVRDHGGVMLEKPFAPDVLLGALDGLLAQAEAAPAPRACAETKGVAVLLVEDEDTTRTALAKLLRYRGHVVHAAKSVDEALAIVRDHRPLDVLLTDLVLPTSPENGDVLARRVLEILPAIRVIVVSGFPWDVVQQRYRLPEGAEFMEKPLELELLERRLEELRDGG